MTRAATVEGVRFLVHPAGDHVSDRMVRTRDWWEGDILRDLVARLGPDARGVVVDAGAMLGTFSAYIARHIPGVEVHAFEPMPANFVLLTANTIDLPNVTRHYRALSDREGTLTMAAAPDNLGHAVVLATDPWPQSGMTPPWEADALTLDALGLRDVLAVKVDVEGHEPAVMAGARATIERDRPLVIIEDWKHVYADLMPPGYRLLAEWETAHQTFLYGPG